MKLFTVEKLFTAELEEKQSRFIAHLAPIADFQSILAELRISHSKASHHVTAFREISITNQINENAKDDGEPAGTSGMPVLKTLIGANLINVGMIITRYFGGTKLGTGGLARAYAGASNLAIQSASIVEWKRIGVIKHHASFATSSNIERQIKIAGLNVLDREFNADGVMFTIEGAVDDIECFETALSG